MEGYELESALGCNLHPPLLQLGYPVSSGQGNIPRRSPVDILHHGLAEIEGWIVFQAQEMSSAGSHCLKGSSASAGLIPVCLIRL